MKRIVLLFICVTTSIPVLVHADESEWVTAAREIIQPVLSAEYDRDMVGVLAYAGNQSIVQIVALVFPLSPDEMTDWQQRFAAALENTAAEAVNQNGEGEVEAENIPASPVPAIRITCSTGEHDGQQGIACNSVFMSF